jgi:prepilin-type N-terminal cleavage/methylation domain-containing protein
MRPRRRPSPPSAVRRSGGFTLIELLIAAALLAVLAVLSWRGLDAVLASRTRIVIASDELRSLTLAFAQLDEDLRRSWPVRLLRLTTPSIGFTVSGEQAAATLEMLREASGAAEPTQVQRVAWRLRDGVLERGFGVWVVSPAAGGSGFGSSGVGSPPGGADGTGPGTAGAAPGSLVWQPVLANVASLQMQGWIAGQGWVAGESLAGQLRGTAPAAATAAPRTGSGANAGEGGRGTALAPTGPAGAAAAAAAAAASPAVTGLLVRVVRTDGRVLQRIFPVKD